MLDDPLVNVEAQRFTKHKPASGLTNLNDVVQPALDCDFGFEQMWRFDQIASRTAVSPAHSNSLISRGKSAEVRLSFSPRSSPAT